MKKKSDSLQALRAVACLTVFLNHCYIGNIVEWGVSVFFVMSGFLLTAGQLDKGMATPSLASLECLRFAWGKIKKLYPLYIITLLPILALDIYNAVSGASDFGTIIKELVLSALLIQSWFPAHSMAFNGVAWYLSTAFFLYFCFPCIMSCVSKYHGKKPAYIAIALLLIGEAALSCLAQVLPRIVPFLFSSVADGDFATWFTYIFPVFRLIDFSLGCNLGYIFVNRNKEEKKSVITAIDISTAVFFVISVATYRLTDKLPGSDAYKHTLIFSPFAMLCVYCFALGKGILPKLLTGKITVRFGDISSSFYLIHQDVIRILYMLSGYTALSFTAVKALLIPISFVLTILAAEIYGCIELTYKKRLTAETR
jgi:peptidoglycan/LPS O-acetylase OafA/YrhL